jgi:hypothetical protein
VSDFGRRTGRTQPQPRAPRQQASGTPAPRQAEPALSDLISKRDLKYIESGRMPAWTNLSRTRFIGFLVFLPLIGLAALGSYAPDVARDLRYAGTFVMAPDLRASEGHCTRYTFLITLCSAKIRSERSGEVDRTTSFMMLFRSGDGAELVPVRSTSDRSAVGISYAVSDVLLTRALSLFGTAAFFGWIWLIFLGCLRKGRYKGGPAHDAVLQYMALRAQPA